MRIQLLNKIPKKVDKFEKDFKVPFPHRLRLVHILEFLNEHKHKINPKIPLNGLIVAPYYGCMKNIPPKLREELFEPTLIESIIQVLGGRSIIWSDRTKCCGTFLAAVKPLEITKVINNIFKNAVNSNAQCIVTACSMCHLTLEMRSTIKDRIPVFHFSEILALSFGENSHIDWFNRHLIDPLPLLKKNGTNIQILIPFFPLHIPPSLCISDPLSLRQDLASVPHLFPLIYLCYQQVLFLYK